MLYEVITGDEYIAPVSLNYSRKESVLEYYTEEELQKFITEKLDNRATIIDADTEDLSIELKEFSEGNRITSYNVCYTKLLRFHRLWTLNISEGRRQ